MIKRIKNSNLFHKVIVGIDPGITGAIAWIDTREPNDVCYEKTPYLVVGKSRKEYDHRKMADILKTFNKDDTIIYIEKVHAMPGNGVVQSFKFGFGYGVWYGIMAALDLVTMDISPQKWKKLMMQGMAKEKEASVYKVKQLYPFLSHLKKSHHGIADAILIARCGLEYETSIR